MLAYADDHPAVLVHEAHLRLVDVESVQRWNSRGHFFSAATGQLSFGP
jgi:hypothetical protein